MTAPSGTRVVELLDEHRAALAQLLDDVLVVDDLLAHVDGRAVQVERALDGLHGAVDARAVAARRGEQDFSIVAQCTSGPCHRGGYCVCRDSAQRPAPHARTPAPRAAARRGAASTGPHAGPAGPPGAHGRPELPGGGAVAHRPRRRRARVAPTAPRPRAAAPAGRTAAARRAGAAAAGRPAHPAGGVGVPRGRQRPPEPARARLPGQPALRQRRAAWLWLTTDDPEQVALSCASGRRTGARGPGPGSCWPRSRSSCATSPPCWRRCSCRWAGARRAGDRPRAGRDPARADPGAGLAGPRRRLPPAALRPPPAAARIARRPPSGAPDASWPRLPPWPAGVAPASVGIGIGLVIASGIAVFVAAGATGNRLTTPTPPSRSPPTRPPASRSSPARWSRPG